MTLPVYGFELAFAVMGFSGLRVTIGDLHIVIEEMPNDMLQRLDAAAGVLAEVDDERRMLTGLIEDAIESSRISTKHGHLPVENLVRFYRSFFKPIGVLLILSLLIP